MKTMVTPALFLLLIFTACSSYFDGNGGPEVTGEIGSLSLSTGGYLSSMTANDITPFYYHDTNTGKNWLFFSSDRDGSYDIFYAEMNADGSFKSPVKMDAGINSGGNEVSPVVYVGRYGTVAVLYSVFLSCIRIGSGQTNLMVFRLNPGFSTVSNFITYTNVTYARISLYNQTNESGLPNLICTRGSASWFEFGWNNASGIWNTNAVSTNSLTNSAYPAFTMCAFLEEYAAGANMNTNYYLMESLVSGKSRLCLGKKGNDGLNRTDVVTLYQSPWNDREPNIDLYTMKVYFASDRYGTFDLFRFNRNTFNKIKN